MPPQCRSLAPSVSRRMPSGRSAARSFSSMPGKVSWNRAIAAGRTACIQTGWGADAEAAGKAGNRRFDLLLRGLELAQHALCTLGGQGAEGGEADAGRDALEQPSAEARLEPGDGAGERRLGDGEALRRRDDLPGLGDREEAGEVCAPFEHRAACGLHRGDGRSVPLSM